MSVEFRQRTPGEYVGMVWKNKWLVVIPTIAVALAVAWVVRYLPNVYESESLLIVRPATISSSLVSRLSESDLLFRINSINQEVLSRSSLEPLIRRYGLYKEELARGASIESLVERMQGQDVNVQIDRSRDDMPNAFNIRFQSQDRNAARSVTEALASKFVNAQITAAQSQSNQTASFFEQQVSETKAQLDAIDNRRLTFMLGSLGQLPDELGPLTGRLTGLYEQQKGYMTEAGRMRDAIAAIETNINTLATVREQQISDVYEAVGDLKNTQAYATLLSRRSQLRAELQEMLTTLKPKNPDVVSKREQVADIDREIKEMLNSQNQRVEQRRKELRDRVDPQAATLRLQLQSYQNEARRQQVQLAQTNAQIAELERRVNAVPGVKVALEGMDREYNTLKVLYDDLLAKANQARVSAAANADSQGEAIQVIDAASLPEEPVKPQRALFYLFGVLLGLGVGVAFVAAREVPRLMTVQNAEDAEHYTNLPVLVSMPEILTKGELRRARLRRFAFATAGLVVAVISVPTLIVVFRFTRLFDILSGVN